MMWVIGFGVIVVLLVVVHSSYDRREDAEGKKTMPRWWREAMDRWGGGFD